MIKTRNQGEYLMELNINGALSAAAGNPGNSATGIVPFAARLKAIVARLRVGAGTSTTMNVQKNGAAIHSSSLIAFTTGVTPSAYNTANLTANPTLFNAYDTVSVIVASVVGGSAADLNLILVFERQRGGSWNDPVQTDTIGADSDAIG